MSDGEGMNVKVYRSERRAETYAYLPAEDDFEDLPEAFRDHFGPAESFLEFHLHDERHLAQADAGQVIAAIREQGFYLQLPPRKDSPEQGTA